MNFKNIFKKYDYQLNEIIGIDNDQKYKLFINNKVIRKYNDNLKKPKQLTTTYINLDAAYFYNFEIEKNILHKVKNLDKFIMSKAYAESGIEKSEKYILKYSIIELKDPKKIKIECILLPETYIKLNYAKYKEEIGYLDYLSFPIFSYKVIYQEKLLEIGKDMFIVFLKDKISITIYNEGEFYFTTMIAGGLKQFYNALSTELDIEDFNEKLFYKILNKKGFNEKKYNEHEKPILSILKKELNKFLNIIQEELNNIYEKYDINNIDRIFITSDYGNIDNIEKELENYFNIESKDFAFYEKYNLDKLPISPFLYMSMLEAHHSYKYNELYYNYTLWKRPPTFFYKPSGQFVLLNTIGGILLSLYPLYLITDNYIMKQNIENLNNQLSPLIKKQVKSTQKLNIETNILQKKIEEYKKQLNNINNVHNLINEIYKFKKDTKNYETPFITNITKSFNKYKVYITSYLKEDNKYIISLYSPEDKNIVNLIKYLSKNYLIINKEIIYEPASKNYKATIKIKR